MNLSNPALNPVILLVSTVPLGKKACMLIVYGAGFELGEGCAYSVVWVQAALEE